MRFELTRDVERFTAPVEGFLAARIERNLLATVLSHVRRGRFQAPGLLFALGIDAQEQVCAAAMRVPPWPLLACDVDGEAAGGLMARWLAEDPAVPGVSAQPACARAIAAAWAHHTGGNLRCRMREAIHQLTDVLDPPRPVAGRLRVADELERELLVEWERAFVQEAGAGVLEEAARNVAARMAIDAQFVWDSGGPVSTLTLSPAIAGTVRIGPVYTPPEHRRCGYASSAVASASRRALAAGAQRCTLFTDLANPTSNKIYAAVGFRRFAEWEEYAFTPGTPQAPRA